MTKNINHIQNYLLISLVLLLTACGGGSSPAASCDTPHTVEYVNNEFLTEDMFVLGGFSASNTTLIHEDGNQGSTFDLDSIILSRVTLTSNSTSGDSLAVSVGTYATGYTSSDTYMVFYIDVDKDAATGQLIDGIGADVLILDNLPNDGPSSPVTAGFQTWNDTNSLWEAAPRLGTLATTASYFSGCTLGLSIYIPLYEGLDTLYGMNVRGVMKLIRLTSGDPNTPVAAPAVNSTSVFDFMVP